MEEGRKEGSREEKREEGGNEGWEGGSLLTALASRRSIFSSLCNALLISTAKKKKNSFIIIITHPHTPFPLSYTLHSANPHSNLPRKYHLQGSGYPIARRPIVPDYHTKC